MLTVTLNIRALRAVLTAVSTEETRYYLNGVNLEFAPDGVIMAATDGHRMIALRQPYGTERPTQAHRSVIVPRDLVAKLKVKHRVIEETTLTIEDDGRLTFEHGGDVFGGRAIDGVFPDYRRVVPQELNGEAAQYNPVYLADFAKARQELGAKTPKNGGSSPVVRYNGLNPAIVDFAFNTDFDAFGVVMPVRDKTAPTAYEWARAPLATDWTAALPETPAQDAA